MAPNKTMRLSNASGQKISEPLSLASNLGQASNQMNGVNDAGYWQLTSLTPVPLPAAFPLLLSGLAALGALRRRRLGRPAAAMRR
jgi:hypothetical protein